MGQGDTLRLILPGQHPQALNAADLRGMPHKTLTYHNAHSNADEAYSGVPLTDLLASHGIPTGDKLRGQALSDYIVATGADGYKAVLSLAETDPSFHPGDVIIADTMDGKPINAKDGPFRLVVTEDKRPARSVHNLVSIEVRVAE
jgi:DMSO/TMAO reductase YedYZ molybdopterin-dependent catalytic subunit